MKERVLFTSEAVSMGHPDKVADQVSDAVLDAMLTGDPDSRVACETMVTTGIAVVAGEITSKAVVDIPAVVRKTICEIGYTDTALGFDGDTCAVMVSLDKQSQDISQGVSEGAGLHQAQGAGDQGLMFGYACNETEELMPLPIMLSRKILDRLTETRQSGEIAYLGPDSKSQVTVEYKDAKPVRVDTVVVSTQHREEADHATIVKDVMEKVIQQVVPAELLDKETIYHINPTGRFVVGGPHGDCGLTGRKIIVDTYGGMGRHGGGAFSGKDPSKVDRSAAYAARHAAKNVVAAGLAEHCEIQLSYAIGVSEPISIRVETMGTGHISDRKIETLVRKTFDLTPKGIISRLDLKRPIFLKTARHGHFGINNPDYTWEKTDMADTLAKEAGLT